MTKFALDILWEKYGLEPFWMDCAAPIVAEHLGVSEKDAENKILNSMVGGSIGVVGSSETKHNCQCDLDPVPHIHYSGNLQFKFRTEIWNPNQSELKV